MEFNKLGYNFRKTSKAGKVFLSYLGKDNDFLQGITWPCSSEDEAMDMVEAVIDPERYPDDEFRARHRSEIMAGCKW